MTRWAVVYWSVSSDGPSDGLALFWRGKLHFLALFSALVFFPDNSKLPYVCITCHKRSKLILIGWIVHRIYIRTYVHIYDTIIRLKGIMGLMHMQRLNQSNWDYLHVHSRPHFDLPEQRWEFRKENEKVRKHKKTKKAIKKKKKEETTLSTKKKENTFLFS